MTDNPTQTPPDDQWSEWLLEARFGRSANFRLKVARVVDTIRDRVLDAARLKANTTLLDVGTGDGLVALGAIERIGPSLRVVMTDASEALLCHTRNTARERGVESQCTFLHGTAERLEGIADASVDVVTTRAVLAYVANKPAALAEIFRVLRPGGRFSMADPILQDEAFATAALTRMLQTQPRRRCPQLRRRHRPARRPNRSATSPGRATRNGERESQAAIVLLSLFVASDASNSFRTLLSDLDDHRHEMFVRAAFQIAFGSADARLAVYPFFCASS